MSNDARDRFEIPKDVQSMAEASFEQARQTFEKFLASAQETAGSLEERGALVKTKDVGEAMRLHGEYVQAQMRALAQQASEMGQIVSRAAMDAIKPKS